MVVAIFGWWLGSLGGGWDLWVAAWDIWVVGVWVVTLAKAGIEKYEYVE